MEKKEEKVRFSDLRAILRYVPLFRGRRFIVAVDGALLNKARMANLFVDLAVLQSLNIHVILVHGAGHQIRQLAKERRVRLTSSDGTGTTDKATLRLSLDAITRLTTRLMQQATVAKVRAAAANVLIAHQAGMVHGVDQGYSGIIDRVDTGTLNAFLNEGLLPIVPPLGFDRKGQTLRLNSDAVATEIALATKASKIVYVTSEHLQDTEGNRLRQLSVDDADALGRTTTTSENLNPLLISKLKNAARACRQGVSRVHLINGNKRDAFLAELFSNEGTGTMIYADAYQEIRAATLADVPAIVAMIRPSVTDEELLPRTAEDVSDQIDDYSVLHVDGNIVGCVALHHYVDFGTVELACLYIKKEHENQGYGRKLIEYSVRKASAMGASNLVALTTGAADFFKRLADFRHGTVEDLPPARREKREATGRNSEIMICPLAVGKMPLAAVH